MRNLRENKKRKEKRKKENKTTQSTVSMGGGGVTYSFCRARAHISILNLGPQKRVSCPRARHLKPPASSLPPPLCLKYLDQQLERLLWTSVLHTSTACQTKMFGHFFVWLFCWHFSVYYVSGFFYIKDNVHHFINLVFFK